MNSWYSCASVKYVLYAFNFIFALGGLGILLIGILFKWNINYYGDVFDEKLNASAILMIVVGSIIFVTSFLGCYGAIRGSNCMLYTHIVFLFVAVGGMTACTVLSYTTSVNTSSDIRSFLDNLMLLYHEGGEEGASAVATWDDMQEWYECCGVDGPDDWPNIVAESIPASCTCKQTTVEDRCTPDHIFSRGCHKTVSRVIVHLQYVIGGTAFGFAILAVVGIFLTCMLTGAITKNEDFYKRLH